MYLQNNDLFTIQSEICRSEAVVAVEVVDAVAAVAVEVVAVDSTETKIWGHQTLSYHLVTWHMYVRKCFVYILNKSVFRVTRWVSHSRTIMNRNDTEFI